MAAGWRSIPKVDTRVRLTLYLSEESDRMPAGLSPIESD